ncbi:B- and T-lymphocyte attenuator-like [Parambassis ranga]|uniref:B- and T-lymphocyte attenuator-like n=1 Tax=Parambassis ranga TaxID=210632 RepID=A0A6P7HKF7_9TELE|nr:B- and T-lymphocyte attenuator [Parambassis ranga]
MGGFIYLLICGCFMCVCADGRHKDVSTCEIELLVRRQTVFRAALGQHVIVKCPVKHCGQSPNVTWCKLLNTNNCERIHESNNTEIIQKHVKDKLISHLTFKQISINDDGLYRCQVHGGAVSHAINISVSVTDDEPENIIPSYYDDETAQLQGPPCNRPWLPYLYICVSVVLTVIALTVIAFRFNGWKRNLTVSRAKTKVMSTQVIPDLPRRSAPPTPVLQTHFSVLNDIYSPSSALTPNPPPTGNQAAVGSTAEKGRGSDCAVYAAINHRQSGTPARKQQRNAKQEKDPEYAVIRLP